MFKKLALTGATVCRVGVASRKLPGKNQGLLPLPPFSFLPFLCPSVSSFPSLSSSGGLNKAPLNAQADSDSLCSPVLGSWACATVHSATFSFVIALNLSSHLPSFVHLLFLGERVSLPRLTLNCLHLSSALSSSVLS